MRKFDNEALVADRYAAGPAQDRDPQRDDGQAEARAQDGERGQRQAGQEPEAAGSVYAE